jgi:non-ribosomal peptide synthetase component F
MESNKIEPEASHATLCLVAGLSASQLARLESFGKSPVNLPMGGPTLLHDVFTATAERHPERPAILGPGMHITYRELDERAEAMASYLRGKGLKAGEFVGIFFTKSSTLYAAILGVLKAGAAYVPLDLSFPMERVSFILSDCGARFLLVGDSNHCPLMDTTWPGTVLDASLVPFKLKNTEQSEVPAVISSSSPAYAIYTSGTTGKPKGVVLPHSSICHLVQAEQVLFGPTHEDRVAQGFSVAFDASCEEIWLAFASGGALVPVLADVMKTPDALPTFLESQKVSRLCVHL